METYFDEVLNRWYTEEEYEQLGLSLVGIMTDLEMWQLIEVERLIDSWK